MKHWAGIAVAIAVCMVSTACREVPHGSVMTDTDAALWTIGDTARVIYRNSDTTALRNIGFTARVEASGAKECRTLPIAIIVTSPSGEKVALDYRFDLAKVRRKALMLEVSEPLVEDAVLAEAGDYMFEFAPDTDLQGVWAIGMEIYYGKR